MGKKSVEPWPLPSHARRERTTGQREFWSNVRNWTDLAHQAVDETARRSPGVQVRDSGRRVESCSAAVSARRVASLRYQ
jgi:hypothetical protein